MDNMHNHHHEYGLVFLSVVVAITASYIALSLLRSTNTAVRIHNFVNLVLFGGMAMGLGIWSAHFIGMLAFSIPGIEIYYDIPLMLISVIAAIIPSILSLISMSNRGNRKRNVLFGSVTLGLGIVGMHYIGIASMILPMEIHWNYWGVGISVIISIIVPYFAYLIVLKSNFNRFTGKILGSLLLGGAIGGMHYTGMLSMMFYENSNFQMPMKDYVSSSDLIYVVLISTLIILTASLLGISIDRALKEQESLNKSLQEGIRQRDEFLSFSSHELKTPLMVLKLNLEMISRKKSRQSLDEHEMNVFLKRQNYTVNKLVQIVDNMVEASRISSGDLELSPEMVNLRDVIENVILKLAPIIEENRIITKMAVSDIKLFIDRFQIENVFYQVIHNAVTYSHDSEIRIALKTEGSYVLFTVKDFGRGISEEDMKNIFRRYERGRNTDDTRGLGLGLFIVSQVVRLYRGKIEIDSKLGKGSEFKIYLPT